MHTDCNSYHVTEEHCKNHKWLLIGCKIIFQEVILTDDEQVVDKCELPIVLSLMNHKLNYNAIINWQQHNQ